MIKKMWITKDISDIFKKGTKHEVMDYNEKDNSYLLGTLECSMWFPASSVRVVGKDEEKFNDRL